LPGRFWLFASRVEVVVSAALAAWSEPENFFGHPGASLTDVDDFFGEASKTKRVLRFTTKAYLLNSGSS
jgi:hypothetical protein